MIHADLVATAATANRFLAAEAASSAVDPPKRAGEAYGSASERLLRRLLRHLGDEEDLIIPPILDRSEAGLGI